MRRACKYLLMNNIYFVIKVVEAEGVDVEVEVGLGGVGQE